MENKYLKNIIYLSGKLDLNIRAPGIESEERKARCDVTINPNGEMFINFCIKEFSLENPWQNETNKEIHGKYQILDEKNKENSISLLFNGNKEKSFERFTEEINGNETKTEKNIAYSSKIKLNLNNGEFSFENQSIFIESFLKVKEHLKKEWMFEKPKIN